MEHRDLLRLQALVIEVALRGEHVDAPRSRHLDRLGPASRRRGLAQVPGNLVGLSDYEPVEHLALFWCEVGHRLAGNSLFALSSS